MGQVQLDNVWKIYDKNFEAVKGISLTINDGEFVSLLGPSGCGKTSTLRMIAGLEEISRGEVHLDGILVNDFDPGSRNIAMAFESYALYPHLTVFENIAYPLRIRRLSEQEIQKQVQEMCESLGITSYMSDYPSALSGGAQQRTGLARAMIRPATLYLLDEVLSHLDATERTMLRGEIRRVQKLTDLTSLFVTHDQLEAMAMSDRIIVMDEGEIQQIGTPEEVYDTPANLFVAGFVGEPPVNIIRASRQSKGNSTTVVISGQSFDLADLGVSWLPGADEFWLGIRPKYVNLQKSGAKGALRGAVHMFENLGDHTLTAIELTDGEMIFMVADVHTQLALDEPVSVGLNPDSILFYDIETKKLVRAEEDQTSES